MLGLYGTKEVVYNLEDFLCIVRKQHLKFEFRSRVTVFSRKSRCVYFGGKNMAINFGFWRADVRTAEASQDLVKDMEFKMSDSCLTVTGRYRHVVNA